jgi:hypothetical protein
MSENHPILTQEWVNLFLSTWLDSDFQPSADAIRQRKWSAVVVSDYLNPMEAEWLADAINMLCPGIVVGIGAEYKSEPDATILAVDRDSLMDFVGGNSWRYALISSLEPAFLYFKDEANRFYLLCGPPAFVAQAYRCSLDTARRMFFDYWVNREYRNDSERRFLTGVWDKYCS